MDIIQTIGTILLGFTGLGFFILAVLDKPLAARSSASAPAIRSRPGIFVPVRLLRSMLAKLKLAAAGGYRVGETTSQDMKKAA